MTPPPLPYPFNFDDKRSFILVYEGKQYQECGRADCPICDAEAQDALTVWENLHR